MKKLLNCEFVYQSLSSVSIFSQHLPLNCEKFFFFILNVYLFVDGDWEVDDANVAGG